MNVAEPLVGWYDSVMSDFIKSIQSYLYQRVSNPLFGAFGVAWLIVNYRVLFILFSGDHYTDNFQAIDTHFQYESLENSRLSDWWAAMLGRVLKGIVSPFLIALFYLLIYPKISAPIAKMVHSGQAILREIRQEAEGKRRLTVEESNELSTKLYKAEQDHNVGLQSIREKLEESETLRKNLALNYEKETAEKDGLISNLQDELTAFNAHPTKNYQRNLEEPTNPNSSEKLVKQNTNSSQSEDDTNLNRELLLIVGNASITTAKIMPELSFSNLNHYIVLADNTEKLGVWSAPEKLDPLTYKTAVEKLSLIPHEVSDSGFTRDLKARDATQIAFTSYIDTILGALPHKTITIHDFIGPDVLASLPAATKNYFEALFGNSTLDIKLEDEQM